MRNAAAIMAVSALLMLGGCELAPKESYQNGFRGTGMNTVMVSSDAAADEVPAPPYDLPESSGVTAGEAYENVQVLANVSREEFDYLMASLTEWVSPAEGCNYCHNPANLASDEVYTKVVARQMIAMNQSINSNWSSHVGNTGVTCWTCHRGNAVPEATWTLPETTAANSVKPNRRGQNHPTSNSAWSSLPNDSVALYLLGGADAQSTRVITKGVYPSEDNRKGVMDAEDSYAIMMHLSQALGVNCTYCHNTQSFQSWATSNPPRATAWHGIEMVRDVNANHITPLASVFPDNRKGVMGDPLKVNCITCHRGQNKPLGGYAMVKDYPALQLAPSEISAAILADAMNGDGEGDDEAASDAAAE